MSDLVFTADFTATSQWVAGRSWAYPDGGPTNPGDNKLDHLTPDPSYSRTKTFRATRRTNGWRHTGLLTTEESDEAFTAHRRPAPDPCLPAQRAERLACDLAPARRRQRRRLSATVGDRGTQTARLHRAVHNQPASV